MNRMKRVLVLIALASLGLWPTAVTAEDVPRHLGPTELEARRQVLEQRVVELHHDVFAARYNHDQAALERAEAELKQTQAERVETLRALGELP